MIDGLKDKYRQAIIEVLSGNKRVERAVLFGSRATGTFTPASDIDLALFGDELTLTDQAEIAAAIDKLPIPQKVDILRFSTIKNKKLIQHIERYGVEWVARKLSRSIHSDRRTVAKHDSIPLGMYADVSSGFAFKSKEFSDQGIPVVKIKNVNNRVVSLSDTQCFPRTLMTKKHERYLLENGDVLIAMTGQGSVGRVGRIRLGGKQECLLNQRVGKFVVDDAHLDLSYLFYVLSSDMYESILFSTGTGSGQPNLSPAQIKSVEIPYPPLPEQKAIAHILGTLDDKIELNRKMNETLEGMARAIFKSWFVDFDPVRIKAQAKAQGKSPDAALKALGLPPETAALFPDAFQDSELGEIPKGWEVRRIEDIADKVACGPFGSSIKVSTFVPEGVPVISGQHLNGIRLLDKDNNFITPEHAEKLKNATVYPEDVIFTHAGSIGQVAYIPETSRYQQYVLSQRQFYLRCNANIASPLFIVHYFKSPNGQHQLLANTSSTGVPSISRPVSYLRSIPIPLPPRKINAIFNSVVLSFDQKSAKLDRESQILVDLRDTLLPKLLSGKIKVANSKEAAV